MCGCFVVGLGAFFPRIALVLLWIFGPTVNVAFNNQILLPILGIILLPYTTLVYVLIYWWQGGVEGYLWFFVALAFIGDIGSWTAGARQRSNPRPPAPAV